MSEYPKPVSKQCTQRILEQMNNNSFGIIKDINQICFFTKIKYHNLQIPVMITNYDIINYIANNNLNIYINNEKNKIDFGKAKYFVKDYSIAIIEIKDNNRISYLELDDYLYINDYQKYYNKESIYILNYNKYDIEVSYRIINHINNSDIIYRDYFNKNNNHILPIFNLSNNKLIGFSISNSKYNNKGSLFNLIIKEFTNEFKHSDNNKWNEINVLMNINKNHINNKIYFLNKDFNNDTILNNKNTELYINNIKIEYKNYFIPEKEGKYNIKIKFNIDLTDCSYMFSNCENITKINFIRFNTKYVNTMKYMFNKCKNLEYINNLILFDTSSVTDISNMFSNCYKLNNLDLSLFNIKNVKNMNHLFDYCYNLKNLKLFYFNNNKIKDIIDIYNKLKIVPNNIKNNKYYEKYPNEIDILIKINKDDINKKIYFLDDFYDHLWNKPRNVCFTELNNKNAVLYINDIKKEYKNYFIPEKEGDYNIKLKFNINLTNCNYMFAYCKNIVYINFICFNTSYIKHMNNMFFECNNLNNLDLSSFDTKNITNMSYMFSGCNNLNNLNLSSFDTKNVTNISYMFSGCYNLNNLNLSSFDTKNVIEMNNMFSGCINLNNLDLTSFDTKNVINMSYMFSGCSNLNKLNLSSFDTKKITNMSYMFSGCNNLNNLNLSSFDTKNVTNMSYMFSYCYNLNNLDLSSFNTKNVKNKSSMLYKCPDSIYESNKSIFKKFKKEELIKEI